jgi:hypothetical protein
MILLFAMIKHISNKYWIISIGKKKAELEDERRLNVVPRFGGASYSGESSDSDDPNDAYYYPGNEKIMKYYLHIPLTICQKHV